MKSFKQFTSNMKSLYVCRYVENGDQIREWFKKNGIDAMVPNDKLHVTIAFSKKSVNWDQIDFDKEKCSIEAGGYRKVAPLGDKGALVLKFKTDLLSKEWQYFRDVGCGWDYDSGYIPHMTITYDAKGLDPATVKPYTGVIKLGPQIHKEVDDSWASKVKEE